MYPANRKLISVSKCIVFSSLDIEWSSFASDPTNSVQLPKRTVLGRGNDEVFVAMWRPGRAFIECGDALQTAKKIILQVFFI